MTFRLSSSCSGSSSGSSSRSGFGSSSRSGLGSGLVLVETRSSPADSRHCPSFLWGRLRSDESCRYPLRSDNVGLRSCDSPLFCCAKQIAEERGEPRTHATEHTQNRITLVLYTQHSSRHPENQNLLPISNDTIHRNEQEHKPQKRITLVLNTQHSGRTGTQTQTTEHNKKTVY